MDDGVYDSPLPEKLYCIFDSILDLLWWIRVR
jgi:hypothetical protein